MPKDARELYQELLKRVKEAQMLSDIDSVLSWDEQVFMPRGGSEYRAELVAYTSGMMHKKFTDPEIGEMISELEQSDLTKDTTSVEAVNIRELRRDYDMMAKLPQKLVEEISRTTSKAVHNWVTARKNNDFATFQPWLEKVVNLMKEKAEHLGYRKESYDALLDEYEAGSNVEFVKSTFEGFKDRLVKLVSNIANSSKKPNMSIIEQYFPVESQKLFGQEAAIAIGFDFERGRLDISAHPFTTGFGPGDTRITSRYNPNHLGQALFGTLHEAGHGIYDQGLPEEFHGSPMGDSVSLGIHESQSRMWENQVGRGKPFWTHFFPRAQQVFPEALGNVAFDDFYFAINDVRPSLIRVEADEVTYNLHILLRFEMEHAMIKGDLQMQDVPGAWNEKFKAYFDITPPSDADGCMQDIHWAHGLFGYFPTYTLGNLYSSQFFAKAKEEIPDLEEQFAIGNFKPLKKWLNEKIHQQGKRYRANNLCEVITGKGLDPNYLMEYLEGKYGELYGF